MPHKSNVYVKCHFQQKRSTEMHFIYSERFMQIFQMKERIKPFHLTLFNKYFPYFLNMQESIFLFFPLSLRQSINCKWFWT
jgi:hypothetical protein